jgi:hypothetical protein
MAFDVDPQSPIFTLQPDHRAQLFNAIGKTRWSFKDLVMGVGLADRKFPNFDRQAVHVSVARRFAEPANALPERTAYRPGSLSFLSDALTEMAQAFAADKTKAVEKLAQSGDARALQVPKSVKRYIIKPGDTIESIARTEMGSGDDAGILEVHRGMKPDVAATFTLLQQRKVHQGRVEHRVRGCEEEYRWTFNNLAHDLSRHFYGKAYRRYRKLVPHAATLEGEGAAKRFHIHAAFRCPEHVDTDEFIRFINLYWTKSPWRMGDNKIESITADWAWAGYISKEGSEALLCAGGF